MAGFFANGEDDATPRTIPNSCRLIHGDAYVELARMKDASTDVVISDPPYSEQTHNGARTNRWSRDGDKATKLVTFAAITPEQFVDFAIQAVRVARRWVVTFCDWKYAHLLEGVGLVRLGVWAKIAPAPQMTGDRPAQGWEAIAILHRPGKKRWNGGGLPAVWRYKHVDAKYHPTQKPLALVRELVKLFSDPGEEILDPFCGSGTTGVACLLTGRRFVGIEKDAHFCAMARKRLARRR